MAHRAGDRLMAMDAPGGREWYHQDSQRTTGTMTDATGSVVSTYRLNPWGEMRGQTGSSTNRQIFTGHQHDTETGLIYMGARYYDPETGRFLTQDAAPGDPQNPPSLNRYLYVYGNPLAYTDPDGNVGIASSLLAQVGSFLSMSGNLQLPTERAAQWITGQQNASAAHIARYEAENAQSNATVLSQLGNGVAEAGEKMWGRFLGVAAAVNGVVDFGANATIAALSGASLAAGVSSDVGTAANMVMFDRASRRMESTASGVGRALLRGLDAGGDAVSRHLDAGAGRPELAMMHWFGERFVGRVAGLARGDAGAISDSIVEGFDLALTVATMGGSRAATVTAEATDGAVALSRGESAAARMFDADDLPDVGGAARMFDADDLPDVGGAPFGGGYIGGGLTDDIAEAMASGVDEVAALVRDPDAHTLTRHGGSVTDAQLMARARTGVAPDGSTLSGGQLPPQSSAFYTDMDAAYSLPAARAEVQRTLALYPAGTTVVRIGPVDTGRVVGRGYPRVGSSSPNPARSGPLQRLDDLTHVQGTFRYNPNSNTWDPITMFPAAAP